MSARIEMRNRVIYVDGSSFAPSVSISLPLTDTGVAIVEHIFDLRIEKRDGEAIDMSNGFFEAFNGVMNSFIMQKNFYAISQLWKRLIAQVSEIEKRHSVEVGRGVHKGTAFFFLGLSQLMMEDIDGAYMSIAAAAEEDKTLPGSFLDRYRNRLTPAEKLLLLDLSTDNFAYGFVKHMRDAVENWQQTHPAISRSKSVFDSIRDARSKSRMELRTLVHLNYALTKVYVLEEKKSLAGPTCLTISQLGESILRFARTLEDFIRLSQQLGRNDKIFCYCQNTWFAVERRKWDGISSYDNNLEGLVDDYLNDIWKLSKDGRNMVLSLKVRNVLAHRIPDVKRLFDRHVEIVLAILNAFGFVCDQVSACATP